MTGRPKFKRVKQKVNNKNGKKGEKKNVKKTSTKPRDGGKVSYMVASATNALFEGQALGAEVLIVDPPRRGLDDEVLAQLCKPHNPKQPLVDNNALLFEPNWSINFANEVNTLIYVSCGFDALARDCDKLLSGNAGWVLESATGYVLFPGSNHVETLAVFRRRGRRRVMEE